MTLTVTAASKMATSMSVIIFLTYLSSFCSYVLCNDGRFMLAHVPSYVTVQSDAGAIPASEIPDLYSLALGFSSSKPVTWRGMLNGNIFRRPKAGVLITVEDVDGTDALKPSSLQSIPIKQVTSGSLNLDSVQEAINSMYGAGKPVVVELASGVEFVRSPKDYPSLFHGLPPLRLDMMMPLLQGPTSVTLDLRPTALNLTHTSDLTFFSELQIMQEVLLKLKENPAVVGDKVPDIYSFELSGFRALQTEYGVDSAQIIDAQNMLAEFIQQWGNEMINLYGGDVFMGVATVPMEAFVHRQGRSLMQLNASSTVKSETVGSTVTMGTAGSTMATTGQPMPSPVFNITPEALNVAPVYDEDFPIFFNIFLWLIVVLAIAIFGVAYVLADMDPGDSIIYRMTSQRIKME